MRILVFLPCLTIGGAEGQGLLVARYLRDRGHAVEVWGFPAPRGRATLLPELHRHGLPHEELPWRPRLRRPFSRLDRWGKSFVGRSIWAIRLRMLAKSLPRRRFDVVIPFTFWPSFVASLLRAEWGAGKCFWNHRGGYDDAGIFYSAFFTRQVLRHGPQFLANSHAGARFLQDRFGLSVAQVSIVPNAYVPGPEAIKEELPCSTRPSNELSLIQVANFFPEKDYETVLRAIQMLDACGSACRLHFCGEFLSPSHQARFLTRIRELGIQDRVVYHGAIARTEVFRLLLDSDIGLLSSKSEGQPNAVMEYMYVGLPVVATRIPGIQELVGEANERWLFEVGDATGLAKLIDRLRGDPTLRAELGRCNRTRIIEHFGPERVLPQWAKLVEEP